MQSIAEAPTGASRAGQRAALLLHLHTPTILPGQGSAFLTSHCLQAACISSPNSWWSAADSQREKSKKMHNSERRKEGKHRQGQTAVGFNFITCQHCFSSSFCLSFCRLLTGPTSTASLLGTPSQQTRKPLWNSSCTALTTIHLFLTITGGPPQPCKHKIYNVLWELFSHFCCQFLWPMSLLIQCTSRLAEW